LLRGELNRGGVGSLALRSSIMHLAAAGTMIATALRGIIEAEKDKEVRPKHGPREGANHANPCVSSPRSPWWRVLLPLALTFGAGPVFSQPAPPPSSAPSQSPTPPQVPAPPGKFQDRIDAAARALRENNSRFKGTSPEYVQRLAEFVSGNMLFVLLHEMAHVSITQMGLPVLGRMEDAADTYATLRLIRSGSNFSRRVLTEAAEGWFMADRRDQKAGDKVAYYDDHGLNQQRAYQIVCLMVGSDDQNFKDLAKETKLPEERQDRSSDRPALR